MEPMTAALALSSLTLLLLAAVASAAAAPRAEDEPRLRVGFCTNDLAPAKAAGFDYAEIGVRDFTALPEPEFEALAQAHRKTGLPTEAGYVFLPAELKIVGPQVDDEKVLAHVSRALARCQRLGVRIIVFGSPAARRAPDGFSRTEAFAQLVSLGKRIAPLAERHGVILAAEPIRRSETNMINTVAEGLAWVDAVGHPSFKFMVDLFHLVEEGESPDVLRAAGARLAYAKLANPKGRLLPLPGDGYDYGPFLRALRAAGYRGPVGMETPRDRLETDGPRSIGFLRGAWAAARQ
jgi:sugar phosphate isomerase/epimerase